MWQLVFDLGTIVGFFLLIVSLWPPANEILTRAWDEYYSVIIGAIAAFLLTWAVDLATTGSALTGQFYLILGVGLILFIEFLRSLRSEDDMAQPS